jgi:hypothetical protein
MGERAGYRVSDAKGRVSWIVRHQWYYGGEKVELEVVVGKIAGCLMQSSYMMGEKDLKIDGGMVALRHDLDIARLFSATVKALGSDCFDSLEADIECDINDHGLYEIELVDWNKWNINHYDVDTYCIRHNTPMYRGDHYDKYIKNAKGLGDCKTSESRLGPKVTLGVVTFKEDKSLETGMKFKWSPTFEVY